jgi:hypothetical protein
MSVEAAMEDTHEDMGAPVYSDGAYWDRLNSNAYDTFDRLDDMAEAWQDEFYRGHGGKRAARERLVTKTIRNMIGRGSAPDVVIDATGFLYPPEPRPAAPAQHQAAYTVTSASTHAPGAATHAGAAVSTASQFKAATAYDVAREQNLRFRGVDKVVIGQLPARAVAVLVAAYDHMMETFNAPEFRSKYGASGDMISDLSFERPVPSYFANVGGETIFRRKALSIAGLRNLVRYGPTIYAQLEQTLFSGRPDAYSGNQGLNLMRQMTGNVVDLDSTVLRCSDQPTLAVINMSNRHKGLPTFGSSHEFGSSVQATEIAIACGTPLLEGFISKFRLSEAQAKARQVHPSQVSASLPVASDNSTRGHCPIWHYVNAGQDSFHANVPCMEDVIGALLRAPFACVEHYASIQLQHVNDPVALRTKLHDFFENCVVDSCFNMKWKSIEEFGAALAHEGTVVDVLQKVQMTNQGVFTSEFFDADTPTQDNEIREMWRLVEGMSGRDKAGELRKITQDDVAKWSRAAAAGKPIEI